MPGGPAWDTEGDYTIRIFDSMTGCEDTANVVVDVWPNLDVAAAPMQGIVCWGEETEVIGELRAVEGTNLDEIPYTLSWSDPDIEGLNPTVPAGTYLLTAENACGIAVDMVEVKQEYCGCDMWVPTAFTPDNDGVNDGFRVETNCPELDEYRFEVFDRWGELIWSTDDPDASVGRPGRRQGHEREPLHPRRRIRVPPVLEIRQARHSRHRGAHRTHPHPPLIPGAPPLHTGDRTRPRPSGYLRRPHSGPAWNHNVN